MRTRTRSITLALVATFAIAGCGADNSNNCNDNSPPTANPTPVATSTPASVKPTVTPTTAGSPVPTVTRTSTPGGTACNGEGAALSVTITSLPGSELDTGWTGISHNTAATHDNQVTTNLDCVGSDCQVDGTNLVGQPFGSPLPLSAGGVSVCVLNSFREAFSGTYNCDSGCSETRGNLLSKVFLVQEASMPCPPCVGDPIPNDGIKGGTCSGGTTPNAACDVGGISDVFNAAGPDFGETSNDCLPKGSPVGQLAIDLNPLTTGTVSVDANVKCVSSKFPPGSCYCPGQIQPNSCLSSTTPGVGTCPASGICEEGPVDAICQGQPFRQCPSGSGTADCENVYPGSGSCIDQPRPCFGTTISRTGVCGTETGTLVSFFCVPATTAPAINTTSGLPGPGGISLPVSQVRTPRP